MIAKYKKLITGLLLLAVCSAIIAGAQQTPKFTSRSRLVLVPVQVKDGKGTPVPNLKQDDFVVLDNGKPQTLFSFDPPAMTAATSLPKPAQRAQPPGEFGNLEQEEAPRHLTIIALDSVNTKAADQAFAKKAVLKFLSSPVVSGPVALIYFNRGEIQFIHHFASDKAELRSALEKAHLPADLNFVIPIDTTHLPAKAKEMVEGMERDQQHVTEQTNADMTADSLRAVARVFALYPGEKTLLWVTGGLRLRGDKPVLSDGYISAEQGRGTANDVWSRAFRALNNANVAVYPVDARGLVAPGDLADRSDVDIAIETNAAKKTQMKSQAHQEFLSTLTWVAGQTGGKALFNSNDITTAVERVTHDAAASYLLTFRLPANATKGWHRLEVKVKDLHVTARPGLWVEAERARGPEEDDLSAALQSPFAERGLPVIVRWSDSPAVDHPGKRTAHFQLAIAPGSVGADERATRLTLDIFALALDEAQKPAGNFRRTIDLPLDADSREKLLRSGFSYSAGMELPPGQYTVKFVVRDNTNGKLGGVLAPLDLR